MVIPPDDLNRTMHIGELAERTGMSLRSLRHYDEIGLVTASGRTEGGFRLYTPEDVERLMLIRRMKPLGYSLDEMRELLELVEGEDEDDDDDYERDHGVAGSRAEALAEVVARAQERRADLARKLEMADEFVGLLRRAVDAAG